MAVAVQSSGLQIGRELPQGPADVREAREARERPRFEQSERELALCTMIEKKYDSYARNRFDFDRQWFHNLICLVGFQYHQWNPARTRLYSEPVPKHRVRLVLNRLFAIAQSRVAKIVRNRPIETVLPGRTDDESLYRARASEKLLRAIDQERKGVIKRLEIAWWLTITGNAFSRVYIDPTLGDLIEQVRTYVRQAFDPQSGQLRNTLEPEKDENDFPIVDRYTLGDVDEEIVSPFELYPHPAGDQMHELQDYIHARMVPVDRARLMYPHIAEYIEPSHDFSMTEFFRSRIRGLASLSYYGPQGTEAEETFEDCVMVKHLVENRSPEYLRGREIVKVGNLIAHEIPKLAYDRFNMVHYGDTYFPGRFWREATFSQVVPVAKAYNRGHSQIIECKNTMGKPKYFIPRTCGLLEESPTSEPSEKIYYNPLVSGHKPEAVAPPPLPEYILRHMEMLLADMEFIGGVSEASRGINPKGVGSGIHFELLTEFDETKFGPLLQDYEEGRATVGNLVLKCVEMIYTEPRLKRILGDSGEYEVFRFSRDDLPSGYEVRVQVGSALPVSKAARQQRVIELHDRGLIVDPATGLPDARITMQLLEFGDYQRYFEDLQQDERNAVVENMAVKRAIQEGEVQGLMKVRLNTFDNDPIHIKHHDRIRKQEWYRQLPREMPVRKYFDFHCQAHAAQQAQKAENAAMMMARQQMIVGGGPGGELLKPSFNERKEEGAGGQKGGERPNPNRGREVGPAAGPPPGTPT